MFQLPRSTWHVLSYSLIVKQVLVNSMLCSGAKRPAAIHSAQNPPPRQTKQQTLPLARANDFHNVPKCCEGQARGLPVANSRAAVGLWQMIKRPKIGRRDKLQENSRTESAAARDRSEGEQPDSGLQPMSSSRADCSPTKTRYPR